MSDFKPLDPEPTPFGDCLARQGRDDTCDAYLAEGKRCPDCPILGEFVDTYPSAPTPLDEIRAKRRARRQGKRVSYFYKAFLFSAFVVGLLMVAIATMPR